MKYFVFFIGALVLLTGLSGCAGDQAKISDSSRASKKKQKTYAESQRDELAEFAKPPILTAGFGRREKSRMGENGSVIETMYDAFGNKTESRVFYNDSFLKMILLQTSTKGVREALIYGQNGEIKFAPADELENILTSAPYEIAKSVEIQERPVNIPILAQMPTGETPALLNYPSINFTTPPTEPSSLSDIAGQAAPPAEPAVQTAPPPKNDSPKVESKEEEALRLRAVVQSLSNVRRAPTARKND